MEGGGRGRLICAISGWRGRGQGAVPMGGGGEEIARRGVPSRSGSLFAVRLAGARTCSLSMGFAVAPGAREPESARCGRLRASAGRSIAFPRVARAPGPGSPRPFPSGAGRGRIKPSRPRRSGHRSTIASFRPLAPSRALFSRWCHRRCVASRGGPWATGGGVRARRRAQQRACARRGGQGARPEVARSEGRWWRAETRSRVSGRSVVAFWLRERWIAWRRCFACRQARGWRGGAQRKGEGDGAGGRTGVRILDPPPPRQLRLAGG